MSITRRNFVKLLATVPVALQFTPLIGEAAGGLYVPVPENFEDCWRWQDPERVPRSWPAEYTTRATACVAWAPLGSKVAYLSVYAGMFTLSDRELERAYRVVPPSREKDFTLNRRLRKQEPELYYRRCMKVRSALIDTKRRDLVQNARKEWKADHYPGWIRAFHKEPEDCGRSSQPVTKKIWTRVGYVRWLKANETREALMSVKP